MEETRSAAARVAVPFSTCTSCTEDGLVCAAEAYCSQCTEYMCEEHRRAHSKTRMTKTHKVTHVRDLLLTDEVVTLEEAMDVPIVPLAPLVPVRRFTLVKRRKITDLIN